MAEDEAAFAEFVASATVATEEAPAAVEAAPVVESKAEVTTEEVKPELVKAEADKKAPEEVKPDWKKAAAVEKAKRLASQNHKANADKLQTKLQQVEHELARFKSIEAKRDTDPLAAAAEFGLDYNKLTKEYIKTLETPNQQETEVGKLTQKIQHVESLLQQQQDSIDRRAQAEAIQSFNADVKKVLETKADDFELVKTAKQGPDLVREIVAAHYRATATFDRAGNLIGAGELMPTEKACQLAEKYLEEDLSQFKATKKFGGKVEAKPVVKPAAPTLSQDMRQGGTKTEPHGDEVEQLLLLKKTLEAQLNASQGN